MHEKEKEKGHCGFMGSIRRMSLVSAHKRHEREKNAELRDAGNINGKLCPSTSNHSDRL